MVSSSKQGVSLTLTGMVIASLPLGMCSKLVEQIGGTAIKLACVALSTAEAEYIALASTAQESVWLQQLLADITTEENGHL